MAIASVRRTGCTAARSRRFRWRRVLARLEVHWEIHCEQGVSPIGAHETWQDSQWGNDDQPVQACAILAQGRPVRQMGS